MVIRSHEVITTSEAAIPPIIRGSVPNVAEARAVSRARARDRHGAVHLVKTPASASFTISIDYKAYLAFYSIGMYKGGWTDYFLAPALDCRESRTHFLYTSCSHILATSHHLLYVCTSRCDFSVEHECTLTSTAAFTVFLPNFKKKIVLYVTSCNAVLTHKS